MPAQEYSIEDLKLIMQEQRDSRCSECKSKSINVYEQKLLILDGTAYISTLYNCKDCEHTNQYLHPLNPA